MGWREQVHIGELTVDYLTMSGVAGGKTTGMLLDADVATGLALTGTYTTNGIKVNQGSIKIHLHNQTAQTYCAEFKFDFQKTTGIGYGIDCICEIEPGGSTPASRTAGGLRAVQGVARVGSGFTLTGGTDIAVYAQFANNGTINGTVYPTAMYGLIEAGGTWTKVAVLSVLWLDSHLAATISAGDAYFLNITNNGATTIWTAAIHVYAGNGITNLLKIGTASGMVSANTAGGSTLNFSNWKTIKIDLDGTTHYLVAAQTIA